MNENKNKYGCHKLDACGSGVYLLIVLLQALQNYFYLT